jgi:hypothetical protein
LSDSLPDRCAGAGGRHSGGWPGDTIYGVYSEFNHYI